LTHYWADIQAGIKIDYKAKSTASSIVALWLEVKKSAHEILNNHLNRANKIKWKLKSNSDPATIDIPDVALHAAIAAQ
jgi:hypothetical protein